ncbi:MAG: Cu(I)-responsive transcriptional regulator [Vibrio sp.]
MTISDVAKKTGLTAKSIRLYEEKGLIGAPARSESGYRLYHAQDVADLQLIARCKRVGFSLDECKHMVMLANDPHRQSRFVKEQAQEKQRQVASKIAELQEIHAQLSAWIQACPGDHHSDCPIIDNLKGQ